MRRLGASTLLLGWAVACTSAEPADLGQITDELVIPMQPRTEGELDPWSLAEVVSLEAGKKKLRLESELVLAWGVDYPNRFRARLSSTLWSTCGMLRGETQLTALTGGSAGLRAALEDQAVELVAGGPEQIELAIEARFTPMTENGCGLTEGRSVPLEISLGVRVVQPIDTVFDLPFECSAQGLRLAPGMGVTGLGGLSSATDFRVGLLDGDGARFTAANAAAEAQSTVRVRGVLPAHDEPKSLAAWVAPPWSGLIEVVPELGASLPVDVVGPERIDRVEAMFQMVGAKLPLPLENGANYGMQGWGVTYNWIVPVVTVLRAEDVPLCSGPSSNWFRLVTETPEVCEVSWREAREGTRVSHIHEGARLRRDGACVLRLEGPELRPRAALPAALRATFQRVAELQDAP